MNRASVDAADDRRARRDALLALQRELEHAARCLERDGLTVEADALRQGLGPWFRVDDEPALTPWRPQDGVVD